MIFPQSFENKCTLLKFSKSKKECKTQDKQAKLSSGKVNQPQAKNDSMKSFWHCLYVSNKYLATRFHFIFFISKYCSFTIQTLYSFCFNQQGVFHINGTIILCSTESRSIKCKQWNQHVLPNTFKNITLFSSLTNHEVSSYF